MGVSTQYVYDKTGNKIAMIDGRGKTTRYTYAGAGIMTGSTDADKLTTKNNLPL